MTRLSHQPNFSLEIDKSCELYHWQANVQGGQQFGNQQIIKLMDEGDFQEHVKPLLREGYADSLADYQRLHPEHTHISLVKKSNSEKLIAGIPFTGRLEQLRPQPGSQAVRRGWVKKVSSFDSPEAKEHGAAADNNLIRKFSAGTTPPVLPR
jgi:hypothetical protein